MKEGDQVYIDGEVPARVHGHYKNFVVVSIHPFLIRGKFDRIEPDKEACVRLLVCHPGNLWNQSRKDIAIESKVMAENLARSMHDPRGSKT